MNHCIYAFMTLVALLCAVLLARGYLQSRSRLLMWSALCFAGFTLSNSMLVVDQVLFPAFDLYRLRLVVTAASLAVLVYGLIMDSD